MPDQTPVTDDDRRAARIWAERWAEAEVATQSGRRNAARVILDTVPAPPATIADELREWGARPLDGLNWTRFHDLADRAEAIEKELAGRKREYIERQEELLASEEKLKDTRLECDEARAEVELLAAQIDRLVETYASEVERLTRENSDLTQRVDSLTVISDEAVSLSYWLADKLGEHVDNQDDETLTETVQRLTERLTATFKEPLKEPGHLPDPADVPDGKAWIVVVNGQRKVGMRCDNAASIDGKPWATSPSRNHEWWVGDHEVTLVRPLVPDTRRVIDKVEDLDALPVGSIVRGKTGRPWRSDGNGHWDCGMSVQNAGYVLHFYGPVTVIHEPMSDSGDGRTPGCPARG